MFPGMNRQEQGDLGEASAVGWYQFNGCTVCIPMGRSPDYDFIADDGVRLLKVQVKSSGQWRRGRWHVAICTRGGNRSWSGVAKYFAATRCDELFVVTVSGQRWRIPSAKVEAQTAIVLGGTKYAEFEVDAGPPLEAAQQLISLPSSAPAG